MKKLLKNKLVSLWKDESAQGITEYILLLVIVVAIVAIFKDRVKDIIGKKATELGSQIGNFSGQ